MRPAADWAEAPYPGARPDCSYVQIDADVVPLVAGPRGFTVHEHDLDGWLVAQGVVPMSARTPVLSYGSNACPSKLVTMRSRDELAGPVVMTRCTVEGWAAAWCDGRRRDGAVPATLVEASGTEGHFLWWVDEFQWAALDLCEGAPTVYALQPVPGIVRTDLGEIVHGVQAYVGVAASRLPRRGACGAPLLVRDVASDLVQPWVQS